MAENEEVKKKEKRAPLPADTASLQDLVKVLREKIRKNRFEKTLGQLADTSLVRKNRRELARVLTALAALEKGAASK